MSIKLLLLLAVTSIHFLQPLPELEQKKEFVINRDNRIIDGLKVIVHKKSEYETQHMLNSQAPLLSPEAIDKVMAALKCANKRHVEHNNILTIIDYSLPSSEKRLWVFDLQRKKLLFNTYVSHGIKSGTLDSKYFSNKNNSKASSIGVFNTEKAYYGRHGLALRLDGLEIGFNGNASRRYIVMHGGWYVSEKFIKRYGRPGRSWGCPALPKKLTKPIINTIKDNALLVAYYPSNDWFLKSRFLNCGNFSSAQNLDGTVSEITPPQGNELREPILFADINKNDSREQNEPIVVMTADNYERIFHTKAPLKRMLRRQIDNTEYIALSNEEFQSMDTNTDKILNNEDKDGLNTVYFVIPVVKIQGGYYRGTDMKIISLGKIKEVSLTSKTIEPKTNYEIHFEAKRLINLKSTNRFIRWLGL